MAKGQIFTEEEKRAIVNETKSSTTNEVASNHGLHPITITKWKRQLKNKRGKRRMTKPKSKTIISNGEENRKLILKMQKEADLTDHKQEAESYKNEVGFWKEEYCSLLRLFRSFQMSHEYVAKESQ